MDRPEGLVGTPSPRASRTYRLLLAIARLVGRGLFGFRTEVVGLRSTCRATRPAARQAGGSRPGCRTGHGSTRSSLADNLPVEPRLVFFGDGRAIFRSRWRRWVFRRIGGVIPIWPGGARAAIESHLAAAAAALDAGAVLCLFPETGPATPPGTARPLGLGVAYFALRTGAPIVPIVLGGTHELYRGRRFRMAVLPAVTGRDLAGLAEADRCRRRGRPRSGRPPTASSRRLHALTADADRGGASAPPSSRPDRASAGAG